MTTKDKCIAGASFVALVLVCAILWFGSVSLLFINIWFAFLLPLSMGGVCILVFLLAPYMRTWQEWADNVKRAVGREV